MAHPAETLSDLRVEIDRIDAAMHGLLMERGTIIDRLIAVKARAGGGSAFRPDREASMMGRLLARHSGPLPLDTVEGIWRIIISTFTYVQSAYAVHADVAAGDAAMRDSARFHFGFTVPLAMHEGPKAVIEAVTASRNDLGLLRLDAGPAAGPWWRLLAATGAPKVIARLPFVERPSHPAGLPVFVIALPSAATPARDVVLYDASIERWRRDLPAALAGIGARIVADGADEVGLALMIEAAGDLPAESLRQALAGAGGPVRLDEIGSHALRPDLGAAGAGG